MNGWLFLVLVSLLLVLFLAQAHTLHRVQLLETRLSSRTQVGLGIGGMGTQSTDLTASIARYPELASRRSLLFVTPQCLSCVRLIDELPWIAENHPGEITVVSAGVLSDHHRNALEDAGVLVMNEASDVHDAFRVVLTPLLVQLTDAGDAISQTHLVDKPQELASLLKVSAK